MDLENPGTARDSVEEAEKLGFVSGAVLPFGIKNHHAPIMQYLNNVEVDASRIKLASPRDKQIMEFIRETV